MIIDVHNHINVEEWIKPLLKGRKEVTFYEGNVPMVTYRPIFYDVDERVEGMDRAGIDATLLYLPTGWARTLEDCKVVNDYVGKAVKKFPKRLIGTAHIPPFGGEKAFKELRRCTQKLGFRAVILMSSLNVVRSSGLFAAIPLDSRDLWPFYKEVANLGITIVVHPMQPMDYTLCRGYDLQRLAGREFDLILGVTRMIYGGVLEEFPNLKVIFAHLGGGISGMKGRLRRGPWLHQPPVNTEIYMKKSFDDYFNQLYFDTAGFRMSENELKCALINISPDHILFGTDYPADYDNYEDVKEWKDIVSGLAKKAKSPEIMGDTAAKLFKL